MGHYTINMTLLFEERDDLEYSLGIQNSVIYHDLIDVLPNLTASESAVQVAFW